MSDTGLSASSRLLKGVLLMASAVAPLQGATESLTVSEITELNLLENGNFSGKQGPSFEGWNFYPEGTKLITAEDNDGPEGGFIARLQTGAAVLALHSARLEVEPDTAYSLVYEQKQESIHIGFGMGGGPTLRWFGEGSGAPKVSFFEKVDGSFDWRTVSHSFVSPPDARSIQISFGKKGAPGVVYLRNVRFAKGSLQRTLDELQVRDFVTAAEAFGYLVKRLEVFHADKGTLTSPELAKEREAITQAAKAARQEILDAARERKMQVTPELEHEIVWAEMVKGAMGFAITPDSPFHPGWRALQDRLQAYRQAWNQWFATENPERIARGMKEHFGEARSYPYAIGISSPMLKVGADVPYTGPIGREANISMARDEEEARQVTLLARERDLENISLEITPLVATGGGAPWKGKAEVHRIDQVRTGSPQYHTERVGMWPDIVNPVSGVGRIAKGGLHSFWVRITSEPGTAPGEYRASVRILEKGKLLEELPLRVTVWNVTIPRPGKFKVVGRFSPNGLKLFYQWPRMKPEVVARWNRFIYNKRWNGTDPFATGLTPNAEGLSAALEEGFNTINLLNVSQLLDYDRESRTYQWPDAAMEEKITRYTRKALEDFRAQAGEAPATQLYLFAFDEQHDRSQYPIMRHVFQLAKRLVPEAKTITTTTYPPLDDLIGSVDAWVPLLGSEKADVVARGAAGDERWFYIYGHPFHPYPNASLIDYPGVEARLSFWLASRQGYEGFLHWLMNGWMDNRPAEGELPKANALAEWNPLAKGRNGEGFFLYPGPEEEPIASVRFELIRDGIEDWELLQMLKEAVAAAPAGAPARLKGEQALRQAGELTPSVQEYSYDMDALMQAREAVAEALMALQP